jgi:DNA-binding PadR family transcriptional regulator
MARQQLQNLTEPMYYVLLSLVEPRHGYAIMLFIREMTQGRIQVGAGTLYALLSRFESEGLIAINKLEENKKIYRLTDDGMDVLVKEYIRLNTLVADGRKIVGEQ